MGKSADISTKRLISLAPDNWVKWVTQIPDIIAGEILNSEFQWISRESDVLIRAESPQYGKFLVLNELQLRYKSQMPKRMRAYAALAEEKYKLPTYPVLVNILKESDAEIPTRYESNFAGLQARQDYRVINLWEVDVEIAFQQPILYEASLCANPQGRRGRIHNTASFASSPRFGVIESVRNCSRFFC